MKLWLVIAAACSLAGCVAPPSGPDPFLQAQLGKTEIDLVRAMGVPTRTYDANGHKFLAFERHGQLAQTWGMGMGMGGGGWGGRWGGGMDDWDSTTQVRDMTCETSFELVGGKAMAYQQHGLGC